MTPRQPNTELIEFKFQAMNEKIDSLQSSTRDGFSSLHEKIDRMYSTFATKEDHKKNEEKISVIEKLVSGINLKIAMVSGGFGVIMFLISKIWN